MALVREWIDGFLDRHRARFNPGDWPDGPEEYREYTGGWIAAFATARVTEAEADAASLSLVAAPPEFRRHHIPYVVGAIVQKRRAEDGSAGSDPREVAYRASLGCNLCGGGPPDGPPSGLVVRWHPRPDPERRIGPTVQCYCTCAYGRWIKKTHAEKNPELLRCFRDLADEETGKAWWLDLPPEGYTLGGYPIGYVPPRPAWLVPKPRPIPASPPAPAPPAAPPDPEPQAEEAPR